MSATRADILLKIVKIAQELISDADDHAAITPDLISEKIDLVVMMNPKWREGLDKDAAIEELIRRFSIWIGQDVTLKNDVGHEAWLTASRKREWRYWQRYREWLERKLSHDAIEALDKSTDNVLGQLEDPVRLGAWDRRGLVVGHVQSGKTGHYSGLICKAADAGYKIVIVLAGLHNNLRSQTQMRLDEAFLGYETKPVLGDLRPIGVGLIDGEPAIRPNYATNRSNNGDFNRAIARNLGISPEQRPWLFVIKKNKTVLELLLKWIQDHVANAHEAETGRRFVNHLSLLLIDDEADNASVDTGEIVFDDEGKPDEEHQPTVINRLIRRLLFSFSRAAYVGYTATPFANIFIHERAATREEGPDLFPSAFIVNLAAPSNYVGPSRIFGLDGDIAGLPLVREISDYAEAGGAFGWMPAKHKSTHVPRHEGHNDIPPSLKTAVNAFLLSCAARHCRGQGNEHCSMLIHVTRYTAVQKQVHIQISEHVRQLQQRLTRRLGHEELLNSLRAQWIDDFAAVTKDLIDRRQDTIGMVPVTWEDIEQVLADVVSDIQVRMINGTAKDALDYADNGTGLKVIAIGGDKLARGLTLEGLTVSYFLRASRMYDTLMQMGRWFGYRPGYLDLCRLYTTYELCEWFRHIAVASEELREEFDIMAASGATPRDYGLKVQSHPTLLVTSPLKMRSARNLQLSFSGQLVETVTFYRDMATLAKNLAAGERFLSHLGSPEVNPIRYRNESKNAWRGYLWEKVSGTLVVDFLSAYKTHPAAHKVNSTLLAEFIGSLIPLGELTQWTVALIGGGTGASADLGNDLRVDMLQREARNEYPDRYSIGRLMSSRDEAIDLDAVAWDVAFELTKAAFHADPARSRTGKEPDEPNGPAIRRVRGIGAEKVPPHPERGVLFLYVLDPNKAGDASGLAPDSPNILGFAASFPASKSGVKVEYKVNNILWEQEYGSAE